MTGTQHSEIDFTWLMANLRVARVNQAVDEDLVGEVETLVVDEKAHFAAETYVLELFRLYLRLSSRIFLATSKKSNERLAGEASIQFLPRMWKQRMISTRKLGKLSA